MATGIVHGIKLAINGRGEKDVLQSDERLFEATRLLSELQTWFPQLQAAIEENDKSWINLGYSLRKIASTAQEIYDEDHAMQTMLETLQDASAQVIRPEVSDDVEDERARAVAELREFNERIRSLRLLHTECMKALKDKDYYVTKVEAMRVSETKATKKVSEKLVEKRMRNEAKLNEVNGELLYKGEKLTRELHVMAERKEQVLGLVLQSLIQTNNLYFSLNPMPAVLAKLAGPLYFSSPSLSVDANAPLAVCSGADVFGPIYSPRSPGSDATSTESSQPATPVSPPKEASTPPRVEVTDEPPRAPSPVLCAPAGIHQFSAQIELPRQ
jgi:hypothetical protein